MKKLTIINAYGDNNIGDSAILATALTILDRASMGRARIAILCENLSTFEKSKSMKSVIRPLQLPYGYAIRSKDQPVSYIQKILRTAEIFLLSFWYIMLGQIHESFLPRKGFYRYIKHIKEADVVIGMGGGYLRTKDQYRDYFGMLLTLLPIWVSNFYQRKLFFLPISFGNFASKVHEWLNFHAVKNSHLILREEVSYNLLQKLGKNAKKDVSLEILPDLALFSQPLRKPAIKTKLKSDYVTLTARTWMSKKKQEAFEDHLEKVIWYLWEKYQLRTVFIPMARNIIEDDDTRVGLRLQSRIKNDNIFSIAKPKGPYEVQMLQNNARFVICTRMHSAILAATVYTPFICISYEHKMIGFLKSFDLLKWSADIQQVNSVFLRKKIDHLMKPSVYNGYVNTLFVKHKEILKVKRELTTRITELISPSLI
jgi:polysaccharide pyruvyl transferase WcaK-like protein